VKEDKIPQKLMPIKELQFNQQKRNKYKSFLTRMVTELVKDLPISFNLEFPQRVCWLRFLIISTVYEKQHLLVNGR
jgi:hypothetical protein